MTKKYLYDLYAASALQGLISKSPLFDTEGERGKPVTQESLHDIKREIARTAHSYACFMMETRQEFIDYCNSKGLLED